MGNRVYIDGVNVAECEHFDDGDCLNPAETVLSCESQPNCLFKQLQRAEAEKQDLIDCYELREGGMLEDIQYWKNKAQEFYKELEQYKKSKQASYENMQAEWNKAVNELRDVKAENEKLKDKAYKDADMIYRLTEENREYDIDLSIEKEAHKSNIERLDKYHKALEDIRESCNTCAKTEDYVIDQTFNEFLENVFNKVNEVLNK